MTLPYVIEPPITSFSTGKGTELYDLLLLDQYRNKPNLRAYHLAYIEELDILFTEMEKVYLGRMLENAFGNQLDVCGIILNQKRNIELPRIWFGFQGAADVDGFSDEADPLNGGLFKDEFLEGYITYPLEDVVYRRVLMAKASLLNEQICSLDNMYQAVTIVIGRVPQLMKVDSTVNRVVTLSISEHDTTTTDASLVSYIGQYFVPVGTTFIVTRVAAP